MSKDFMLKFQSVDSMIHVLHSELKTIRLQLIVSWTELDDSVFLPPEDCYIIPKTEEALISVSPHDARTERIR